MKKYSFYFIGLLTIICSAFTLNSSGPIPFFTSQTTYLEFKDYNGKDKETGIHRIELLKRNTNSATITHSTYENDERSLTLLPIVVSSDENSTDYDMSLLVTSTLGYRFVPSEKIDMEFPHEVKVGDELTNGVIKGKLYEEGNEQHAGKLEIICSNTKVIAKKDLVTPAGTFPAYQVEFNQYTKAMLIKSNFKKTFWFNVDMGIIQTDKYSMNGKYKGKSVLSAVVTE